jgi:ParB-like nuclease domain
LGKGSKRLNQLARFYRCAGGRGNRRAWAIAPAATLDQADKVVVAALLGEAPASQPWRRFAEAAAGDLMPQRLVPIELIEALAQSIRKKGVLQPLLVPPLTGEKTDFELVTGERR